MARGKSWISAIMAVLLLLLAAPVYASDDTAAGAGDSGDASYVRIKNKWKSNYLYEASDGTVRYGFTAIDDQTSHWQIEELNGSKRIKNRATGHYMTIAETPQRRSPLYSRALTESAASDQWIIADASRKGYVIIKHAATPEANLVIHQEDQLGFAEASGDINVTFESPQWRLEPVVDGGVPVRIVNQFKAGSYLYEDDNSFVKYSADIGANDSTSHWYVQTIEQADGSAKVWLRNRATGHYISQGPEIWQELKAGALDGPKSEWTMKSAADPVYVTFSNNSAPADKVYVLNAEFPSDTNARSNDWAQPTFGSAQWRIEQAWDVQPLRIASYSDNPAAASYLYEDSGIVKYGALAGPAHASYQWLIDDYDGKKLIRNLATGHYMRSPEAATEPLQAVPIDHMDAGFQWTTAASAIYDDYKTIMSAAVPDQYLHIADALGTAQAGTVDPNTNAAQWAFEDPAAATDGTPQYVRIMNEWQSMYLYEDPNGDLKYGNARSGDLRDQWLVERYQGRKRIKNRETNHYINMQQMTDGRIRVSDVQDDWKSAVWVIEDTGGGTRLIHSVLDANDAEGAQKYIHLQNLTKFAEYGIINPGWGSPRWKFVTVAKDATKSIRLKSKITGQYLYEVTDEGADKGKVKAAALPASDTSSVWYAEDTGDGVGSVRLKNIQTGHYISMEGVGADVEQEAPGFKLVAETIYPQWGSAKWYMEHGAAEGYMNIKSAWAGHYIYTDTGADAGYTKVSKAAAGEDAGQFAIEETELPKTPLPAVPVRIKSAANGQYLYENTAGVVLYGNVEADNGYAHWLLVTEDGKSSIRNRVTGHYMTVKGDYNYIEAEADQSDAGAAWAIEEQGTAYMLRSLRDGYDDEYIHVQNGAGYAERGLYPSSFGTLQWTFETASESFEAPEMGEERDEVTGTTILPDTNDVEIAAGDRKISEQNGKAVAVDRRAEVGDHALWRFEEFNGRKLLRNKATGKLLSTDLTTSDGASLTNAQQWTLEERLGRFVLSNAAKPAGRLLLQAGALRYGEPTAAGSTAWEVTPVSGTAVYEAEEAFRSVSLATADATAGYSGSGYTSGMSTGSDLVRFAVHAQEAGSYKASLRYLANEAGALTLTMNGEPAGTVEFEATEGWRTAEKALTLRSGINTVTVQPAKGQSSTIALDSLTIDKSVNKAYRGAALPYVTYEAEHAATNGVVLEPTRAYREMASEASGRQAVKLAETGDYVEFTLAKAANAMVLRYAIPDSEDGSGQQATLGLYVNGQFRQKLKLTSKYAWEYGSYPWSNDPKQGSAHRFFDEIHALIGDVPAGATIRLEKDEDSAADYYVIDLADMEQAAGPLAMPQGFVSVAEYGAIANDDGDDTAAFHAAMTAAKSEGKGIWFPAGEFELREGLLDLSDIKLRGAGMWHTTLTGAKFIGRGGTIEVYDLLVDGDLNIRDDEASTHGFEGEFGPGSVIQNVWLEHTKTGLWLTQLKGSSGYTDGLHMIGLRMRNLMADGINFCVGTSNSMIEQSDIRYPGDDGIAMWSTGGLASTNNTARFNTVSLPWLADNLVIFGGKDNKMTDNIAKDTIVNGAGLAVSTRFNPVPFSGTTIAARNTLIRTGSYDNGYGVNLGAIWLFASDKDFSGDFVISDNTAIDSTYSGLIVHGDFNVKNVTVRNLVVDGVGTNGIDVTSNVKGSVAVDNVIVRGDRIAMVNDANPNFAFVEQEGEGFASLQKLSITLGTGRSGPFALQQGSTLPLHIFVLNIGEVEDASVTFADNSIATFSGGQVKGLRAGETVMRVVYEGLSRQYTVKVGTTGGGSINNPVPVVAAPSPVAQQGIAAASKPEENDKAFMKEVGNGQKKVTIDVSVPSANGKVAFTLNALSEAAKSEPDTVLVITREDASYSFPLALLSKVLEHNGVTDADDAEGATWSFFIQPAAADATASIRGDAAQQGLEVVGQPTEFAMMVQIGSRTIEVTSFGGNYVERVMTVDGEFDGRGLSAFVYDSDNGEFRYVPALVTAKDGKTSATIKSMGNSLYVLAKQVRTFADTLGHWAQSDIELLASKGIVSGVNAKAFEPTRTVTRAEFASMLVRALGLRDIGSAASFKDVPKGSWYEEDVQRAVAAGIIKGDERGAFRPGAAVTREEMAIMAMQAMAVATGGKPTAAALSYRDASAIHAWAAEAVGQASASGLMRGLPDGTFAPGGHVTRGEAATLIKRLLVSAKLMNE